MQTALHQHACSADLDRFSNFFVNRFEIEDVPFRSQFALERTIESAKRTIFRAEVRVINIAIDDVGDYTYRMQLAPNGIGLHADADQVVGAKHLESLLLRQGHLSSILSG